MSGGTSKIRALVVDFDGLVLDTESCVYESWQLVYADNGLELPLDRWSAVIGSDNSAFDPLAELRARVGPDLDVDAVQRRRRRHRDSLLEQLDPMPGVTARLSEARASGLALAMASSSSRSWVEEHLARLGLREFFDAMATEDDVEVVKPAPDLYLHATAALAVRPSEAIAIEDSPNGVAAARAAGLRCVAVPGPMTRQLCFDHANLVLESLADCDRPEMIERAVAAPESGSG
jgi:HAD superfamily hydrolase (TIGR01509 family)